MSLKRMWKNDYFKTVIAIVLIVAIVLGFFFGLELALNTPYPMLTVESGSMSVPYGASDYNLWLTLTHPFDRTLSVGDIIIVQGIDPKNLNTNYPNSDIIVFHDPMNPSELIVHRIIGTEVVGNTTYFLTKGDGNGNPWPQAPPGPESSLDPWDRISSPRGVPQNMVVGKVIMRIPWFGWVTLLMRNNSWGLPAIIALIALLVVIEFIVPILREKKKTENQNKTNQPSQMYL